MKEEKLTHQLLTSSKYDGCDRCSYKEETAIKEFCNNPKSPRYQLSPYPNQKACKYAELKIQKEPGILEVMRHNIKAYNKNMSNRYLRKQTPLQLLHLAHPLDRREFAIALCKAKLVTTAQVQEYIKA